MTLVERIIRQATRKSLREALEEMPGLSAKNYKATYQGQDAGYVNIDIMPTKSIVPELEDVWTKEETYDHLGNKFLLIKRVYVKDEFAHKGLGKEMINKALSLAKENQCDSAMLIASPIEDERLTTDQLVNYYKGLGFVKLTELGDDALMIKKV